MITYRNLGLCGRLGNALFELASTIGIAKAVGEEVMFPANWMHRPYFSVPDELFGDVPPEAREAASPEFVSWMDPRAMPYLQNIHLFYNHIDLIREYLKPSPAAQELVDAAAMRPPECGLPPYPKIGVHIRRGDKVLGADPGVPNNTDYHLCPSLEYYRRGLKELPNGNIVVISDDVPWCREYFLEGQWFGTGHPHPKEHEPDFLTNEPEDWIDLFLLAQCDHFVISGSTFGIWGAILADVPNTSVVRPDKIYGPLVSWGDESIVFHPQWKVIPHAA